MRAFNAQAMGQQIGCALGADQKGDIRARLRELRAKVTADTAGAKNQKFHGEYSQSKSGDSEIEETVT